MRVRKTAEERREEIIGATLALAHEVGPDRITTEAIAGRVGLTQAAIFRHFPRKRDIWDAVLGWVRAAMARRWAEALAGCTTAEARLDALLGAQLRFVAAVPAVPAMLLSRELAGRDDAGGVVLGLMGEFRRAIAQVVEDGQAAGELRRDASPEKVADLLICIVQGTAVRWLIAQKAFDLPAEGLAAARLAVEGLRRAPQTRSSSFSTASGRPSSRSQT